MKVKRTFAVQGLGIGIERKEEICCDFPIRPFLISLNILEFRGTPLLLLHLNARNHGVLHQRHLQGFGEGGADISAVSEWEKAGNQMENGPSAPLLEKFRFQLVTALVWTAIPCSSVLASCSASPEWKN